MMADASRTYERTVAPGSDQASNDAGQSYLGGLGYNDANNTLGNKSRQKSKYTLRTDENLLSGQVMN